jgi:hypothetical protein
MTLERLQLVHSYVDTALDQLIRADMMRLPDPRMPLEMYDSTRATRQDWKPWKPIASTVTDEDLDDLEARTGLKFPPLYRAFLQYKHFYELPGGWIWFEKHLPGRWKEDLLRLYFDSWDPDDIIHAGLIPFGSFTDTGAACFDTRVKLDGGDHPVVLWDHDWMHVKPLFSSSARMFESLLFIVRQEIDFLYFDPDDDPALLRQKLPLMRQFLAIDPDGAGGVAREWWTGGGVDPWI